MAANNSQEKEVTPYISSPVLSSETSSVIPAEYDERVAKRAIRKADFWLVGFYSLVYIFRVVDSSNYSNAAIINLEHGTGIKKELNLNPSQWAWTLSIFSYSYLIFEPTNTILLKKFQPSRWMFVLILVWGICACSVGSVKSFSGMMCARFAIGMAEAGFYPSVLYHMAFWYKPSDMPWRIALFYSVGQIASAISGLLAFAIGYMDGLGGLAGWRWLFVLEGLPAIILSVIALFGLPDYPETAKMLTKDEREHIIQRLAGAAPSGHGKNWSFADIKQLFKDPTVYTFAIYWVAHGIGGFGVSYALPTVIYQLGFTTTSLSQLMNMVPGDTSIPIFMRILISFFPTCSLRILLAFSFSTPWVSCCTKNGSDHGQLLSQVRYICPASGPYSCQY
jgi:MFS family permease